MFKEDKSAFFVDFGEQATLTVGTVTSIVTVLFTLETIDFAGAEILSGYQDEEISLTGLVNDFSAAKRGDTIVVRGQSYTLKNDPRDDFTGFMMVTLQEKA